MDPEEIKASITSDAVPVEALAMALLPLGLCILHRDVVSEALGLLQVVEDKEGLSGDLLRQLEDRLIAAMTGKAS